jgi:hypothetical protein
MNGASIYNPKNRKYSSVDYIDSDVQFLLDRLFEENMVTAFCYTVDDDILQIYHDTLKNVAEKKFYQDRRSEFFDNYVRGEAPSDLRACFYVVVDTKEVVLELVDRINAESYADRLDLLYYEYDISGYYFLKINARSSNKYTRLQELKEQTGANRVVVFGSGSSDIEMMQMADLSLCLNNAPEEVKAIATKVLPTDNPDEILKTIEKIYHVKDFSAYKQKLQTR